jgi:ABC-type glutathione transport system ATPase component
VKIIKAKGSSKTPEKSKKVEREIDLAEAKRILEEFYVEMISVFTASNKHLIVGRDKEETEIVEKLSIKSKKGNLVYICGHPGQGKTVVLD